MGTRAIIRNDHEIAKEVVGLATVIDLSHRITHGMETYPPLPGPVISDHLSRSEAASVYGPGVTFHIGRIDMVANTGTYVDAPSHRFEHGADLAELDIGRLVDRPAVCLPCPDRAITPGHLPADGFDGNAVLLRTGWSRHFGTPAYGHDAPFLTAEGAAHLVEGGASVVGIDSINIDDTGDPQRPAHSTLLGADIPIVEHLTRLDRLPANGFRFTALPPAVVGLGTFPVRAVAVVAS